MIIKATMASIAIAAVITFAATRSDNQPAQEEQPTPLKKSDRLQTRPDQNQIRHALLNANQVEQIPTATTSMQAIPQPAPKHREPSRKRKARR